jgi:hypothetical protein
MIFKPAARYPADPRAVFILALSSFSGLTALALKAAPESLEAVLPRWGVILWGVLLTLGSITTLAGMARQTVNGIITEQVGSVMVGVTTVYWAILAIKVIGDSAMQDVAIILAWGLACIWRWGQLQALIISSYKRGKRKEAEQGDALKRAEQSIRDQIVVDQADSDAQNAMDRRDDADGTGSADGARQ